jgi:rhomboid protease GluP
MVSPSIIGLTCSSFRRKTLHTVLLNGYGMPMLNDLNPQTDMPDQDVEELDILELRRPVLFSLGIMLMVALCMTITLEIGVKLLAVVNGDLEIGNVLIESSLGFCLLVILLGSILRRKMVFARPLEPIRFFRDHVELPAHINSNARRKLSYSDILSVYLAGNPGQSRILIESARHIFVFEPFHFEKEGGPERLFVEVRRHILNLANGREILNQMEQRRLLAARALATRPWVTQSILGILVVVFLNQLLANAVDTYGIIGWGGNAGFLVSQGEWFRLLSANFLHGGMAHLLLNGIALYSLGGVMERILGRQRYLIVYLLSGLGATLSSAIFLEVSVSAGASGCILGLFGGLAITNWMFWTHLPLGFRQTPRWWMTIIGVNVALPVLFPVIDIAGHLGGFVVGAIVTYLLLREEQQLRISPPATPLHHVMAWALTALYGVGLGSALWKAKDFNDHTRVAYAIQIAQQHQHRQDLNPYQANELAWIIAVHPDSNAQNLQLAADLAKRAVEILSDNDLDTRARFFVPEESLQNARWSQEMAFNDTLATVLYRQKRYADAAALQLQQMAKRPEQQQLSAEIWSQLERFLRAHMEEGPPLRRALPPVTDVTLQVERKTGKLPRVVATVKQAAQTSKTFYFLVSRSTKAMGLLTLTLESAGLSEIKYLPPTSLPLLNDVEFVLAATSDTTKEQPQNKPRQWTWHPTDQKVLGYAR